MVTRPLLYYTTYLSVAGVGNKNLPSQRIVEIRLHILNPPTKSQFSQELYQHTFYLYLQLILKHLSKSVV